MTITKNNIIVLDALMSGKYLQASITKKMSKKFTTDTCLSVASAYYALRKLEDMGIIVGYIPIISEDGHKMIETFRQMYKMNKEDSLLEMVNDG